MKLISWGANTYGQLGQGIKSEQCILPVDVKNENILNPDSIASIKGGGGHSLILTKDGKIFACGLNTKGQLALGINEEYTIFQEVKLLEAYYVTQICCGWDSSLAVTKSGELLAWGSNTYGQLGVSKTKIPFTATPLKVTVPVLKSVATGLRHSAMVTEDGRVLVCGNGRKGQLGLVDSSGTPLSETDQPQEVPGLSDICKIACGQHYTIAISRTGRVFAWGCNKHGQLGLDPTLHLSVYTPMEIQTFPQDLCQDCKLFCGWTHAAILTENGKIINWGRNTYGQLGCHEYQRPVSWKPQIMTNVGYIKEMVAGSEHNIAILDTGQMVSWGWNEHGNCGTGTQEDVRVPTSIGSVTQSSFLLGSGAGHSFAVISA